MWTAAQMSGCRFAAASLMAARSSRPERADLRVDAG